MTASQVVTFRIGGDEFAADILAVERVLRWTQPTPVPNLPPWVDGVLEYQERVVPVIDLRRRFGLAAERTGSTASRIIVFAVGDDWIGAVVDSVLEVLTLDAASVTPPPAMFRGLRADYLRGLVRRGGHIVIFLDVPSLLTATEQLELRQAMVGERTHG